MVDAGIATCQVGVKVCAASPVDALALKSFVAVGALPAAGRVYGYVGKMLDFLDEIKGVLPKDTDLVNLFDAVVDSVTSLKYRLENLS